MKISFFLRLLLLFSNLFNIINGADDVNADIDCEIIINIPSKCDGDYCSESDAGNCLTYNEYSGCAVCEENYWKESFQYPCMDCQESFGDGCLECEDWNGCKSCNSRYILKWSDEYNINYCDPIDCDTDGNIVNCVDKPTCFLKCPSTCDNSPCKCDDSLSVDYDPNCINCQDWGCTQCDTENGYFKRDPNSPCMQCQEVFGTDCLHCADYNGCQECISGTLTWDNDCGLNYCNQCDTPCPTMSPTRSPSDSPTRVPSGAPSDAPSRVPSDSPTRVPSDSPTRAPTSLPTRAPIRTPIPGETFTLEDGSGTILLSETSSYVDVDSMGECSLDYDSEGNLLSTSYFDIYYNDESEIDYLQIGYVLIGGEWIIDYLPESCNYIPAAKIISIEYNNGYVRIYIIDAKLTEYIDELDIDVSNVPMYEVNTVTVKEESLTQLQDNLINSGIDEAYIKLTKIGCASFDDDGNIIEIYDDNTLCQGVVGSVTDTIRSLVNDGRRRVRRQLLFWGAIVDWVEDEVVSPIEEGVAYIVDATTEVPLIGDVIEYALDALTDLSTVELTGNVGFDIEHDIFFEVSSYKNSKLICTTYGSPSVKLSGDISARITFELIPTITITQFWISVNSNLDIDMFGESTINGNLEFEWTAFEKEKLQVFFVGSVPILVKFQVSGTLYVSIPISSTITFDAEVKNVDITFEGEMNDDYTWTLTPSISIESFNTNSKFEFQTDGEDDVNIANGVPCIKGTITPIFEVKFSVFFYETIEFYVSFPFNFETDYKYPDTCTDNIEVCESKDYYKMSAAIDVNLPVNIGIAVGNDELGFTAYDNKYEIAYYDIGTIDKICFDMSEILESFGDECCSSLIPIREYSTSSYSNLWCYTTDFEARCGNDWIYFDYIGDLLRSETGTFTIPVYQKDNAYTIDLNEVGDGSQEIVGYLSDSSEDGLVLYRYDCADDTASSGKGYKFYAGTRLYYSIYCDVTSEILMGYISEPIEAN